MYQLLYLLAKNIFVNNFFGYLFFDFIVYASSGGLAYGPSYCPMGRELFTAQPSGPPKAQAITSPGYYGKHLYICKIPKISSKILYWSNHIYYLAI